VPQHGVPPLHVFKPAPVTILSLLQPGELATSTLTYVSLSRLFDLGPCTQ
jgi:hypothetical protein